MKQVFLVLRIDFWKNKLPFHFVKNKSYSYSRGVWIRCNSSKDQTEEKREFDRSLKAFLNMESACQTMFQ